MQIKGIPIRDMGFIISETLITQKQFEGVLDYNPSQFKGMNNPVEFVSWYDAIAFCNKLSELRNLEPCYDISHARYEKDIYPPRLTQASVNTMSNKSGYRLPTAMQWIYCYGKDKWSGTDDPNLVSEYAHFNSTSTIEVKSLKPNHIGLYDMSGNLNEWSENQYVYGGSWENKNIESISINNTDQPYPNTKLATLGFRIIRNFF